MAVCMKQMVIILWIALLKENIIPDSIFAVNDPVAIGAFQRIKEAGLKIPEDIAIVGFSNNKITSLVESSNNNSKSAFF